MMLMNVMTHRMMWLVVLLAIVILAGLGAVLVMGGHLPGALRGTTDEHYWNYYANVV